MRKEVDITISDEGRDKSKVFHLQEMPASRAEKWAMRALMAVAKSGVDIGSASNAGMAGIAMLGLEALMKVDFEDVEPLLDEMMACVSVKPDPARPQVVRMLMEDDIEEIATRISLRSEVLKLHMGFSPPVFLSKPTSETQETTPPSSNIPTSPGPSVQYSQSPRTKARR